MLTPGRQCNTRKIHSALMCLAMKYQSDVISHIHRAIFKPFDATNLPPLYILLPLHLPDFLLQIRVDKLDIRQQSFQQSIL